MTKTIRVENADNAPYKVVVITEDFIEGVWVEAKREYLQYPTSMISPTITRDRRLIIEEDKS